MLWKGHVIWKMYSHSEPQIVRKNLRVCSRVDFHSSSTESTSRLWFPNNYHQNLLITVAWHKNWMCNSFRKQTQSTHWKPVHWYFIELQPTNLNTISNSQNCLHRSKVFQGVTHILTTNLHVYRQTGTQPSLNCNSSNPLSGSDWEEKKMLKWLVTSHQLPHHHATPHQTLT